MGGTSDDDETAGVEADGQRSAVRLTTGITVSYREQGAANGSAVVLLHPWLESEGAFSLVLPHLPPWLRVLAPGQRGCGRSDKPPGGYELPSLAADVVAFLDSLGVGSAVLVGASSGGYTAQEVAVANPDRVAGLVLAGTPRSLHGRTPSFAAELADLRDPIDEAWARAFVDSFVAPGVVAEEFLQARVRDALAVPAQLWRETLTALIRSEPPASERISAPTLVMSGTRDSLLDDDAEALVRAIPSSRRVEYPEAGHLIHWEQPERLAHDVTSFAQEVFGVGK